MNAPDEKGKAFQTESEAHPNTEQAPIPAPLQDETFRFIKLKNKQKEPLGKWNDPSNQYRYGSPGLRQHIRTGGNYGVLTGPGKLCVLDVDDPARIEPTGILERFKGTFTVSTGKGFHYYFISPDFTGKRLLMDGADQLGDFRGGIGFYVVGPGSTHPSGPRYEVVHNVPLMELSAEEVNKLADRITPPKPQAIPKREAPRDTGREGSITEELNLQVTDFLMPDKATRQGQEWIGVHPVHGSETGTNLHLNPAKNSWQCFRCNSGGGPLEALAVAEGIIECRDAGPGCLDGKWPDVFAALEKRGYRINPPRRRGHPLNIPPRPQAGTATGPPTQEAGPDQDLPAVPPPGQWSGDFCDFDSKGNIIRLNFAAIGDHIRSRHVIVPFNGKNYVYDPGTGIYRVNEGELEKEIGDIARMVGYKGSVTRSAKEILFYAAYSQTPIREYPFNRCNDIIPVLNGVIKTDYVTGTVTLLPHSAEHMVTFTLPVAYDPQADPEEIERIITEWVPQEDVPILFQIPAQALYQMQADKTFKRSYILQGDYNAGKSTYMNLLKAFFGDGNICHVSLQDIGGDRFSSAKLENKILNSFDDLPDQDLSNIGRFKNLTGHTHHAIERKYENGYDGRIFCTHVFSCNRPPNVPGDALFDVAFWERWVYVHFPFAFPTDPTFEERYFTELNKSAFLNKVLESLIQIRKTNALVVNLEASEVMERWTRQADPLCSFIDEKMNRLEKGHTDFDKNKLFEEYQKYFEAEKYNPKLLIRTLNQFTRDLLKYKMTAMKTSVKREDRKLDVISYRGPYEWKDPTTRKSMDAKPRDLDAFGIK